MAEASKKDKSDSSASQAPSEILAEHEEYIRAVIRFQAGGVFDEEDVFQEFFLTFVCRPLSSDIRCSRSYLYRAITNHIADMARRGTCYRRHLKNYAKEKRNSINSHPAPNACIDKEQRSATMAYMVRHLRGRHAQAFALKYRDNCSIKEIAARMGVDRRTVSRYLCESLKTLRSLWRLNEESGYEKT